MNEEVIYESPREGWRVEYEESNLSFIRSIHSGYWVCDGFYSHLEDAEEYARNLERQGHRVRIVKVAVGYSVEPGAS